MERKELNGNGILNYKDGCVYLGDYVEGKPHGKGKMTFANQDSYEGEWLNGKMHGHGEYYRYNVDKDKYVEHYTGEFVAGLIHGIGRMKYENNAVYEGQWQGGMRTGIGTLWISPEEYCHGLWKFNTLIRGVRHLANGDWYEGTFKDGNFHGYGRYFYSTGVLLEGEFENGKLEKGVSISPSGIIKNVGLL